MFWKPSIENKYLVPEERLLNLKTLGFRGETVIVELVLSLLDPINLPVIW
jgi:hypothetical protein